MPYSNIKKHVEESFNLHAELAEIILYGETLGEKTPKPFVLNNIQRWGMRHLLECPECAANMLTFIKELANIEQTRMFNPPFK